MNDTLLAITILIGDQGIDWINHILDMYFIQEHLN